MKVSDFVIKFLESKKIDTVFTVSGGGSIFLCDALFKAKKIKYISCHHEQSVSYAAESYARVKNAPGAAIVTTGPGGQIQYQVLLHVGLTLFPPYLLVKFI